MQAIAIFTNGEARHSDASFDVIASCAKNTSRSTTIMAVVGAWVTQIGRLTFAGTPASERLSAYRAGVSLQCNDPIEHRRGHASSIFSYLGVPFGFKFRVILDLGPYSLAALFTVFCVVCFTGRNFLRGIIVGAPSFSDVIALVVFATSSKFLFSVLLIPLAMIGFVGFPFLGGAIALFHAVPQLYDLKLHYL